MLLTDWADLTMREFLIHLAWEPVEYAFSFMLVCFGIASLRATRKK